MRPIKKLALLVDGGCLRAYAKDTGRTYLPNLIEAVARSVPEADEELFRVLYYDCEPFTGVLTLPATATKKEQKGTKWLHELETRDLFAVRRGVLKFRGWDLKDKSKPPKSDADYEPRFEQKGVDMRIGLDIANYSVNRIVDRLAIITADTDMIPAFKFARQSGIQVALIGMDGCSRPNHELIAHVDYYRVTKWPPAPTGKVATVPAPVPLPAFPPLKP